MWRMLRPSGTPLCTPDTIAAVRGEIWTSEPVLPRAGQSRMRLILSVDAFNAAGPTVMGVHVVEVDPGGLLSVRADPHGWAGV